MYGFPLTPRCLCMRSSCRCTVCAQFSALASTHHAQVPTLGDAGPWQFVALVFMGTCLALAAAGGVGGGPMLVWLHTCNAHAYSVGVLILRCVITKFFAMCALADLYLPNCKTACSLCFPKQQVPILVSQREHN
jgi:hypothetical protein